MSRTDAATIQSPDAQGAGLTAERLDALRYNNATTHPFEVGGIMRGLMAEGVRVLDVGCGTGAVTAAANQGKDNEVIGIEPDPSRAVAARERGLEVYNQFLDAEFIGRKGPFDVVMLSDVIEHVPSPDKLIRLSMLALRPGGYMLISVPNVAHWSVRLNLLRGRFDYEAVGIMDATHLRWFTERTIRAVVESCGLKVERVCHSAGRDLTVYSSRPLKFIPGRARNFAVRSLCRMFPRLFGAQHVIKARFQN